MGLYIKGIEMPTKVLTVEIHPDGYVCLRNGNKVGKAVPVPKHGRCIDADELFKEMERKGWFDNADRDKAEDLVLDAPTIIPAELQVHHGTFAAASEEEAKRRLTGEGEK